MRSSAECISGQDSYRSWWRWGKNPYATQSGNAARNQRQSVNAGSTTGTASPAGSPSRTQAAIASISGDATGERLPTTASSNSSSSPSASPISSRARRSASGSPSPGGSRQSTANSARAGITLIFSPAEISVGANVVPSVGSSIAASRGSVARMRARAPSGSDGSSPIASRNARGSSTTS